MLSSIAIGGAATLIPDEATLANYLTITTASIRNFRIVGDTVLANIINSYEIGSTALTFENDTNIRYFNQGIGGISTGFTRYFTESSVYYVTSKTEGRCSSDQMYEGSNLKYAFFENADTLRGYKCFSGLENTKIYLGNLQFLDRITSGGNSPFANSTNVDIYVPVGAPSIPGGGYNRINILDTTTPNAVTDLSLSDFGFKYAKLDFTEIANADFYEIWVFRNSVWEFLGEIQPNERYLLGLEENTNYQFKIATCDQYWNGSGFFEDIAKQAFSSVINVTTPQLPALFQNAVAYYKLDETSGDAIDVVNGYNGTLFGGVTQGVAGKIGTAYSFDGTSGYIDVDNDNDFSFTDGTNDTSFTLRIWFDSNDITQVQTLFSKMIDLNNLEYLVRILNEKIQIRLYSGTSVTTDLRTIETTNVINTLNSFNHLVITYNQEILEYKIYLNSIELILNVSEIGNYTGMSIRNSSLNIGRLNFNDSGLFNGTLDEITIIKGEAWDAGKVSDDYNNGNGRTI